MNESIIVVRSGASTVKAFFNVCRHKGSRVCLEAEGKKRMFTCPYHAWTYGLDGRLANARSMGAGFNPADYSLVPCSVQTLCGLIFINLSDKSRADFEHLYGNYEPLLNFHGLQKRRLRRGTITLRTPTGSWCWKIFSSATIARRRTLNTAGSIPRKPYWPWAPVRIPN